MAPSRCMEAYLINCRDHRRVGKDVLFEDPLGEVGHSDCPHFPCDEVDVQNLASVMRVRSMGTFLVNSLHLCPCVLDLPIGEDITSAIGTRRKRRMVAVRVQVKRPVDQIYCCRLSVRLCVTEGFLRTIEVVGAEVSQSLLERCLDTRVVRAPQFTGDLSHSEYRQAWIPWLRHIRRSPIAGRQIYEFPRQPLSRFRTPCLRINRAENAWINTTQTMHSQYACIPLP